MRSVEFHARIADYIWVEPDLSFSVLIYNNGTLRGELQGSYRGPVNLNPRLERTSSIVQRKMSVEGRYSSNINYDEVSALWWELPVVLPRPWTGQTETLNILRSVSSH